MNVRGAVDQILILDALFIVFGLLSVGLKLSLLFLWLFGFLRF
jgi:hypothetical protein